MQQLIHPRRPLNFLTRAHTKKNTKSAFFRYIPILI